MKKQSILFVINYLDLGGAGKMIKYVANLSARHIGDVTMLTLYEKERSSDLNTEISYISLGLENRGGLIERYKLIRGIRKVIKNEKTDAVCSFVSDICYTTRLATLGLKVKVLSAERGDPFTLPFIWKKLMGWTYRNSDYCFFQLPKARDFFGKEVAGKSFVIPNVFIPENGITPYYGERKKTIVSAGRFVAEKRYETLISAFAKVHNEHPEYKMILYGEGPFLEQYKQQAESLGIAGLIEYPGYVRGVAKTIREDGIFVLSSRYEGIPNSLIEALSVGIPCVSTDCTPGGPRFLTKDGKNGLLVPVDDVDAMATAINAIIEDKELARRLSENGPTIIDELSDETISKKWLDAFETILNGKHDKQ